MAIQFEDAEKPVVQRENEFREVVKYLAKNPNAVKSYTVSGGTFEENFAQAEADKRKMAEAGNELSPQVTVRTRNETLNDGKSIKVYLYATAKIKRKAKTPAK